MGYSREIYQRAREVMDARRQQAQMRADQRKSELYAALPSLRQLEQRLAQTGAAAAKAALAGGDDAQAGIARLRNENLALQEERANILREAGLAPDFLAVQYDCPACGDTGYVGQKQCDCMTRLLHRLAFDKLSDTSGIDTCRFENFNLSYYSTEPSGAYAIVPRKAMEKVFETCRAYACNFTSRADSLLLLGGTGLGKTHLSLAIASKATQAGFGVVYTPCQRLMDKLTQQQFGRGEVSDYLQMARECDLLMIDDLGAEFSTTFTVAALYNLINARIIENRPCVISTNLDETGLRERYGDRILSRLLCVYRPLQFYGEDIRMMKRFSAK